MTETSRGQISKQRSGGRLLVVHTGGIGDFIVTFPALALLRAQYEIVCAGTLERMELAVWAGVADKAIELDALGFSSVFGTPNARLRQALVDFDGVLAWMRDDDGTLAQTLAQLVPGRVYCAPGRPPDEWNAHASAYFLEHAASYLETEPGVPSLPPIPRSCAHELSGALHSPTLIHAGSGDSGKNWPLSEFIRVTEALELRGHTVRWIAGPAEEERLVLPAHVQLLERLRLRELATELAQCRLYIGNDSGISHLAALAGAPAVCVFGPTNAGVWAPRGRRVTVLKGTPWPEGSAVLDAALSLSP